MTVIRLTWTSDLPSPHPLVSVLESNQAFDKLPTGIHSLVCAVKLEAKCSNDNNHEGVSEHTRQDTRTVAGCVLLTEHSRSNDATNRTTTNEGGRRKCSFPLAANVI